MAGFLGMKWNNINHQLCLQNLSISIHGLFVHLLAFTQKSTFLLQNIHKTETFKWKRKNAYRISCASSGFFLGALTHYLK